MKGMELGLMKLDVGATRNELCIDKESTAAFTPDIYFYCYFRCPLFERSLRNVVKFDVHFYMFITAIKTYD